MLPHAAARRVAVAALALVAALLLPARAYASLKITWDCYLPNTGLDCVVIEHSLTSKIPFLERVRDKNDADVSVTVSSVPAENGTRFKFDFVGKTIDGFTAQVHTTDKVPVGIDSSTVTVRVMTKLERGLDDFMDQKEAAEVKNGVLTLDLVDPDRLPFTGRPEQSSVKWYLAPGVGAYFSDVQGVGVNASGSASIAFNDSETRWRAQQSIAASYARQSQPVPGTDGETASISFTGASARNVVSLDLTKDHRVSAAVLLAGEKNPQANYRMRANGSVGLEFDLVPRLTANQKSLGVHCAAGPELEHYDAANIEGIDEQVVGRQFCDAFFSWHFAPVDLATTLGETSILKDIAYRSFSAAFSATWRVTDNLTISPWVTLQQIEKAINEATPSNVTYTDPRQEIEASMRAAVEQGYTAPFGIQSALSVQYVFGNGSLNSEDQRWKGASNLR